MKFQKTYFVLIAVLLAACTSNRNKQPVDYVNPFIGTGGHGHTFPGATMPHGMVQCSPDTRLEGWDGCSGYHYSDSLVYGFSHTHLSGTGCEDYCDILVMPTIGETKWDNGYKSGNGYRSAFQKKKEVAEAGYYATFLDTYKIKAELTATERVGFHCYTFPETGQANILIDLKHRDPVTDASLRILNDSTVEGFRKSRSWAKDQYVYFVARFSKPFKSHEIALHDTVFPGCSETHNETNVKAALHFDAQNEEKILVKVALSAVSCENALANLQAELPGWNFEATRQQCRDAWNKELSRIEVEGGSEDQKTVFYTALYHCMVAPNLYTDVNKQYRGRDLAVHTAGFDYYTVFSLWDTYRAWHPLMTLIDQKRTSDYIKTFLTQYQQGGLLPVWELSSCETYCMIGYHSIPVIVDAYMKGIRDFDPELALQAMKTSATKDQFGIPAFIRDGFITSDREHESVSKTLEYAYDDWCIAVFAKALGKTEDYETYIERAQYYKNLYDAQTGNMRARTNGGWYAPFDPSEVNYHYTEANSWQYSFAATQDINGLMALHGGKDQLAKKLDDLFSASTQTTGREQSDITGLIGQYAHGNEPSHHIAYLYNFVGQPWKTQELVHQIMTGFYSNNPDGLIGNEDVGQMSAWAVLSAMGFYSVNPGSTFYTLGTPLFKKVTIHLENGKTFVIQANGLNKNKFYIEKATLNGKEHHASFIDQADILNGGELVLEMAGKPNKNWGVGEGNEPVTAITDRLITLAPFIKDPTKVFIDKHTVELLAEPQSKIYYRDKKNAGKPVFTEYTTPFDITQATEIEFYAEKNGVKSKTLSAKFYKLPNDKDCRLLTQPATQYSSNTNLTLVDGIRGEEDFRIGGWLGFQEINCEAVVDLRAEKKISKFGMGFLQDINAWIFMPLKVEFFTSNDGKNFTSVGVVQNDVPNDQWGTILKTFYLKTAPVSARYVKAVAYNIGHCPPGHKGDNGPAWIFCDEVIVE